METEAFDQTAAEYARFADDWTVGRSPLYGEIARGVAGDAALVEFLLTLPKPKRQPNLLLAAVRFLHGLAADYAEFRDFVVANADTLRATMLARATQTNEPARCATLLPLLARLKPPLALIEVGASAGLCLLPELYAYDYGGHVLRPQSPVVEPPLFHCEADAATPLPTSLPNVVWRAGLDLNPLDAADAEDAAWLEALVWPGLDYRLANLRAARAVAAQARPRIVKGDLRTDLAALAAEAPADATLVIFHTAVVMYVAVREERQAFAESAMSLGHWISNEAPGVFPHVDAPPHPDGPPAFLLTLDAQPIAWTDPHGASIRWIGNL